MSIREVAAELSSYLIKLGVRGVVVFDGNRIMVQVDNRRYLQLVPEVFMETPIAKTVGSLVLINMLPKDVEPL